MVTQRQTLDPFVVRKLSQIYYSPESPGSFQGAKKIYHIWNERGLSRKHKVTLQQIKEWLQDQRSYALNKPVRRNFPRAPVIVSGLFDQFDMDLFSMAKFSEDNDGITNILVVIDVFSRKAWVQPLADKSAKSLLAAFAKIFPRGRNKPRRIRSDRGSEFTNREVMRYFAQMGVHQFFSNNEKQANYAERFIKTLKTKIFRYLNTLSNNSKRYINVLQDLVTSYNNSPHKGLNNRKPNAVTKKNERQIWWERYWPSRTFTKEIPFRVKVGDLVRISSLRHAFAREYDSKWTREVFRVARRYRNVSNQPMYKIEDLAGEPIAGSFYQYELQRVTSSLETIFQRQTVVKRKKGGLKLVKFDDFPPKFNTWTTKPDSLIKPAQVSEGMR